MPPRPRSAGLLAAAALAAVGAATAAAAMQGASAAPRTGVTWTSPALDGAVYGRPVLSGTTLVVVTENDSLYGLDAATGTILWHRRVAAPVPQSSLPCGDIFPLGITGTPVVDGGVVYAVAEDLRNAAVQHTLVGLDVSTGALTLRRSADPAGMDPTVQQQRAALRVTGGMVVVAYGGLDGDCGDYHGWVVTIPEAGGALHAWHDTRSGREGGIWATYGPSIASDGSIYVATGNGSATSPGSTYDGSDGVIHLSASLQLLGRFAPSTWISDNAADADLGSVSPLLLPDSRIFQSGKSGNGYLLDASHLGGIGGQLASAQVCGGAAFGGMAYLNGSVFVPCTSGLTQVGITSASSFSVGWHTSSGATGPPLVAGGLVWSEDFGAGRLDGLDPSTGALSRQFPTHGPEHFAAAVTDGSSLFFPDGDVVDAFSLG